ncbi:MAG: acyltransferase [Actinomycetota bacterium]
MTNSTRTATVRDSRLDVARGVAILGVVIVHVYRGLYGAGRVDEGTTFWVDNLTGFWCLSVFAFVGGTFVPRGVRKRGVASYVRDRVPRFAVIYCIWTALQGGIQLLAADSANVPVTPLTVLSLWRPIGHLWYLPFLILVTVVVVPLKPWLRPRGAWVLGAAFVVSVLFWGYDGGYIGTQGLALLVFFVGGMVLGADRVTATLDRFNVVVAAVIGVAVLVASSLLATALDATAPTFDHGGRTVATVAIGVVIAFISSAALVLAGHGLRSASLLAFLGRRSLDIYLAHVIIAAGTRIVLTHLGVTALWIFVVAGFLMAVVGSLIAGSLARRIKLGWIFDGPAWFGTAAPVRPAAPRAEQA